MKRIIRSAEMASNRIIQTGKLVLSRNVEINNPATANSTIKTGNIGGAIGGIPVNTHDTVGDKTTSKMTNRQLKNMLPTIIGINIGKNAGPKPRK